MFSYRMLCWVLLVLSTASTGQASPDPRPAAETSDAGISARDREQARRSFQAGATAYGAGEYLAAIQAFERSYKLTPWPAIAFSLAQAERRQFFVGHDVAHLERAIELFRGYLEHVPEGGRRVDAVEALSQLEPLAAVQTPIDPAAGLAAVVARPTRLMVSCTAEGAEVILDNTPKVAAPLIREVSPGVHQVVVQARGYHPTVRRLVAIEGELVPLEVELREQPSTLDVNVEPKADIYLDSVLIGKQRHHVRLRVRPGQRRLVVVNNGHRSHTALVRLSRGQTRAVQVELAPTPQRRFARGFLAASGVGVVASAVLGVLTLEAQSRAGDFLTERNERNMTASELTRYRGALRERNGYRTATFSTLGASAALLGTALLLFEWDEPPGDQLEAPSLAPEREPPRGRQLTLGATPDGNGMNVAMRLAL